jgi:hypothetical protein
MAGITKQRLKELVKEVMTEESEYQAFFQKALDKAGKSIPSMSDEEKKAFFDKIDTAWNGKGEKNEALVGGQKELDVDKDGDIGGDDLADLRAGKKVEEAYDGPMAIRSSHKLKVGEKINSEDEDGKKQLVQVVKYSGNGIYIVKPIKEGKVNEGRYDADLDKIEAAVKNATSFMNVGSELKKAGIKYDFTTSMIPMYMIKVSGNTIAIVNKKYASDAEKIVGDIAIGLLN